MADSEQGGDGTRPRLIVGISGASGAIYGLRMLERLRDLPVESHLVISQAGGLTLKEETGRTVAEVEALADVVHRNGNIGASIASGSFRTLGMVVAPCSMKTLAEIAGGVTQSLISRAADVVLKERRRLVLMARETPLHEGHLENMLRVTRMGAIVAPPVPAFYARPDSIERMVDQSVGRVLDLFDLDAAGVSRWSGLNRRD
ncbi:MAG: UbiX family flavin prenyltransferase [Pseudomonadota bacterium]|nr:UbiX family flavin prenyltransferase [Pseudomonadota bacterium]